MNWRICSKLFLYTSLLCFVINYIKSQTGIVPQVFMKARKIWAELYNMFTACHRRHSAILSESSSQFPFWETWKSFWCHWICTAAKLIPYTHLVSYFLMLEWVGLLKWQLRYCIQLRSWEYKGIEGRCGLASFIIIVCLFFPRNRQSELIENCVPSISTHED